MAKDKQVKTSEDLAFELSKQFGKDQIQWRVQRQTRDGTSAKVLAYVDARAVQDRLNEVMGIDGWQCKHISYGAKTNCHLGLKFNGEWIWRSDGAGDTNFEADKGAISDSLKRAAVHFGVGRHLYDLPSVFVKVQKDQRGQIKINQDDCWEAVRRKQSDFS